MRFATIVIFAVVFVPVTCGQETQVDNPTKIDDAAAQGLIEEFRDHQPPDWTYSDLASKADLIVIAKAISKTEVIRNDEIEGDFFKESTRLMANRLKVLSVLKGQSGDDIDVMTLEWKPTHLIAINFDFAEFRPKLLRPIVVSIRDQGEVVGFGEIVSGNPTYTIEPEYLLYLKRHEDGKYTAVTGHRYSGLSVRMLNN